MTGQRDETYEQRRRRERIEAARVRFDRSRKYLHLGDRWRLRVFTSAVEAAADIREWRDANNQARGDYEDEVVVLNVAREVWADEIQEAAAEDPLMDPVTVATILAGLRCPSRPYCTGCVACQTVTAPHRPCREPERSSW